MGHVAQAQGRPEDAATAAFVAYESHQWQALAHAVDPFALKAFQASELALIAACLDQRAAMRGGNAGGVAAGGFSWGDVLTQDQRVRLGSVRIDLFAGAPAFKELIALTPEVFFRRWLEAVHASEPFPADRERSIRRRTLGAVLEGDTLAHVLYRRSGGDARDEPPWAVEVVALRKHAGAWRILLPNQDLASPLRLMQQLLRPDTR